MTRDDDDLWFEALAGRATRDTDASREAQGLRAAMLAREVHDAEVEHTDPVREQMLLARARRDGVLAAPRRSRPTLPLSLAAAAVVCLTLGLWFVERPRDDAFVVRSTPDGTIRMEATDPQALKRRLLADLRAAGVTANGYQRLGAEGIDADLPPVLPDEVAAVLSRYRLALPPDGVLRVEIVAPSQ